MNLKTVSAALAAALLAVSVTACNRNAGTGSSASDQYGKRSGSAATGSSPSSPSSPSGSMGSSSSKQAPSGANSSSSSNSGTSGSSK